MTTSGDGGASTTKEAPVIFTELQWAAHKIKDAVTIEYGPRRLRLVQERIESELHEIVPDKTEPEGNLDAEVLLEKLPLILPDVTLTCLHASWSCWICQDNDLEDASRCSQPRQEERRLRRGDCQSKRL